MAWVYLIRNGDLYKIGRTDNVRRRMQELRPDEQVQTLETSRSHEIEKQLHRRYSAKRIPQTEYFRLTPQEVDAVKKVLAGGSSAPIIGSSVTAAALRRVDESERKWNAEQALKVEKARKEEQSRPVVDQAETDRRYQEYLAGIRGNSERLRKLMEEQEKGAPPSEPNLLQAETDRRYKEYLARIRGTQS